MCHTDIVIFDKASSAHDQITIQLSLDDIMVIVRTISVHFNGPIRCKRLAPLQEVDSRRVGSPITTPQGGNLTFYLYCIIIVIIYLYYQIN